MPSPLHLGATRADPQSPELPPEQARGSLPGSKEDGGEGLFLFAQALARSPPPSVVATA